ncbi:MAG: N-acetylglucosamine kinase [Bacillota bacterium]
MELVLGVDGGSTKTEAAVADLDGRVRGFGRAGGSNWETIGVEEAVRSIRSAVKQALAMAGAGMADLRAAHLGLAGIDWPEDEERLRAALSVLGLPDGYTLENDAFLGVRAESPDGYGIGVGAGTGVCACLIPRTGEPYFYGSFMDFGGGMEIDAQTIAAVIRAEDGRGPKTSLTAPLLAALGCSSVTELVRAIAREGLSPSDRIIRPILFAVAAEGDRMALHIVRGFARGWPSAP